MSKNLPDVFFFNPTCEYAIANGNTTWHPNLLLQKMEKELSTMQMFIAKAKDYVIVEQKPSASFIESLQQLGFEIPHFINKKDALSSKSFVSQKKDKLLPWGWSPAAHKLLSPLKDSCSDSFKNSPVFNWNKNSRNLYSKKFASEILNSLLNEYPSEYFIPQSQFTECVTSQKEIENLLVKWGKVMVKAPWSSSGRGLQPITFTPVHPKVWEKVLAIIKDQGYAIVEPYLDKELDLAFQFELKKGKIEFLGFSNFSTDYKGQYNGNSLNGLPDSLEKETLEFAHFMPKIIIPALIEILESTKLAECYEGFFGVDTLIYRNDQNEIRINPCLEINLRQNMGLLSLEFEKVIAGNRKGVFRTFYNPRQSFFKLKNEMEKNNPLVIKNGKIESGFLALTEAGEQTMFGAYLLV